MKYLICLLLMSCGTTIKVKGGTDNRAEGTVTQEHVIKIDVSGCLQLPEDDRLPCIEALADTLKEVANAAKILLCVKDLERKSGDESLDTLEQCREILTMEDGDSGT